MHRGVRVDGATVHNLRTSKGWSQRQLAQAAGISERTVRNAEKSSVLESYIANYLAIALDVPLNDIVLQRATTSRGTKLKSQIRKLSLGYSKAILLGSVEQLLSQLHPKIQWNCHAAPEQLFSGQFQGISQVHAFVREAAQWWEQFSAKPSDFAVRKLDAEGDMIFFQLSGTVSRDLSEKLEVWQTFVCRLDDDLVSVVDLYVGISIASTKKPTQSDRIAGRN